MDIVKVLVADAMEKNIRKIARIVENDPYLSLSGSVHNGYEAVAHVISNPPDVVVMDIIMESRLAGLYATREILKISPQVKIIIYTEQNTAFYISKAFMFGATDYLIKDASDKDIAKTIICAYQNRSIIHHEAATYLRKEFIQLKNAQENLATTMKIILKLTQSELDILKLLQSGMKQKEIAKIRFVEMTTIKTHVSNLLKKFSKQSTAEMLEMVEITGFFLLIEESV